MSNKTMDSAHNARFADRLSKLGYGHLAKTLFKLGDGKVAEKLSRLGDEKLVEKLLKLEDSKVVDKLAKLGDDKLAEKLSQLKNKKNEEKAKSVKKSIVKPEKDLTTLSTLDDDDITNDADKQFVRTGMSGKDRVSRLSNFSLEKITRFLENQNKILTHKKSSKIWESERKNLPLTSELVDTSDDSDEEEKSNKQHVVHNGNESEKIQHGHSSHHDSHSNSSSHESRRSKSHQHIDKHDHKHSTREKYSEKVKIDQPKPAAEKVKIDQTKPAAEKVKIDQTKPAAEKVKIDQPKPAAEKVKTDEREPVKEKVKIVQPKPKKKIKRRHIRPPVEPLLGFTDILRLAQQKSQEPIKMPTAVKKPKIPERPLTQDEKDRLDRRRNKNDKLVRPAVGPGKPKTESNALKEKVISKNISKPGGSVSRSDKSGSGPNMSGSDSPVFKKDAHHRLNSSVNNDYKVPRNIPVKSLHKVSKSEVNNSNFSHEKLNEKSRTHVKSVSSNNLSGSLKSHQNKSGSERSSVPSRHEKEKSSLPERSFVSSHEKSKVSLPERSSHHKSEKSSLPERSSYEKTKLSHPERSLHHKEKSSLEKTKLSLPEKSSMSSQNKKGRLSLPDRSSVSSHKKAKLSLPEKSLVPSHHEKKTSSHPHKSTFLSSKKSAPGKLSKSMLHDKQRLSVPEKTLKLEKSNISTNFSSSKHKHSSENVQKNKPTSSNSVPCQKHSKLKALPKKTNGCKPPVVFLGENENLLVCGPGRKSSGVSSPDPEPTNPFDRIYSQIKKNHPQTKKRKHNVIEDDSEDEYDKEMDDFIVGSEEDEYDGGTDISSCIRNIFGYDKRKFRYESDADIAGMETKWREQLKEEARSARLGLQEDLEDIKMEEEELKRKEMRREKKKHL